VVTLHRLLAVALVFGRARTAHAGDDTPKGKEPLSEAALIQLAKSDIDPRPYCSCRCPASQEKSEVKPRCRGHVSLSVASAT